MANRTNSESYVPPTNPAYWTITHIVETDVVVAHNVGPCKTAYDAWRAAHLFGDFNKYNYEWHEEKQ